MGRVECWRSSRHRILANNIRGFFVIPAMSLLSYSFTQYFETDDPEFYKSKVCFILNNDVSEMDLVFAEEKYSKTGQLEKVREAIPEGGIV